jgi:hypothetical protein
MMSKEDAEAAVKSELRARKLTKPMTPAEVLRSAKKCTASFSSEAKAIDYPISELGPSVGNPRCSIMAEVAAEISAEEVFALMLETACEDFEILQALIDGEIQVAAPKSDEATPANKHDHRKAHRACAGRAEARRALHSSSAAGSEGFGIGLGKPPRMRIPRSTASVGKRSDPIWPSKSVQTQFT